MSDTGLAYLLARAALVEDRVRAVVLHRRADDPMPDDPFRGLYLSDEAVDRLLQDTRSSPTPDATRLDKVEREADTAEGSGAVLRLRRLQRAAELSTLDLDLLLIALVPDLDSRFERLYGYLNDDVTRRRATVGLALEVAGVPVAAAAARARLAPGAPLVDRALAQVEDLDRPFLTRGIRVPDRVTAHLLGDDTPDPVVAAISAPTTAYDGPLAADLARALQAGVRLVHVRDQAGGTGRALAAAALGRVGRTVVSLDLARAAAEPDPAALAVLAGREALLSGSGVIAGPVEDLAAASPVALRLLASLPLPVLLVGASTWDPRWSGEVPLLVDASALTPTERTDVWVRELDGAGADVDPASVTAHFVLGPDQVARAVRAAERAAALSGGPVTADLLRGGARAQNAAGLERLSRRISPQVGWDDLVLPPAVTAQLREVTARARHRDRVLTEWRMRPGGGRGKGITALFAGDSGTGKTMSAEVIAGELGLDLYAVDLATVVDKYVGETEKNLERIFSEAGGVNAVLLFDEADAIFGKRSEVRDAHDRYANIESAYLLQRMESFDGLAILSTNLRANIDDAFTRRLDSIIDFPTPTEDLRLALWRHCLAPPLPSDDSLDLEFCARSFELCGGSIRSVALSAAYLAAQSGRPLGMSELIAAVYQEYRKLGRLVLDREFGPYMSLVR